MPQTNPLQTPKFSGPVVIQDNRTDGYWIETFKVDETDRCPGLLVFGLGSGEVTVLDNPLNGVCADAKTGEWKPTVIKKFNSPVAVTLADCAGSGRQDIIICHDYGKTLMTCDPHGGHITWLENPGRKNGCVVGDWKERYIGRWPAMHRLKAGYFTQQSLLEVIALPIVHGPADLNTPAPVLIFQKPEKVLESLEWRRSVIDDECHTVIHDCYTSRFKAQNGRNSLFVASRSGIDWMHWDDQKWKQLHITDGMPKRPGMNFYGSACVSIGEVGGDPAACIVTADAFHGTTVTALLKRSIGPESPEWERHVLDVYGTPEQIQTGGDGPCHHVISGDFDGDGNDEFLVALFGPPPHQGVYYYKAIDLEKGVFAKWKIAEESAARIACGDFYGNGKLDMATIVYHVEQYHESPNPRVNLYKHDFNVGRCEPEILSTVWGGEALFYIPKPTDIKTAKKSPLLEVAGYRITLEIHPPNSNIMATKGDAVKVLFGQLLDGTTVRRALNVPQFGKASAKLVTKTIKTEKEGVIFLRFSPLQGPKATGWKTAKDVPVKNLFEFSYPQLQLPSNLKFKKVESKGLPPPCVGHTPDIDFYNMSGIDFRFMDKTPLCHVQFWVAGKEVDAGVHNHNDNIFLEVHLSLSAGTKNGGMWRLKSDDKFDKCHPGDNPPEDFIPLTLDALEHHGGFWNKDCLGNLIYRENGTVDYPYHKWQAGNKGQDVDVWVAFEYNPSLDY